MVRSFQLLRFGDRPLRTKLTTVTYGLHPAPTLSPSPLGFKHGPPCRSVTNARAESKTSMRRDSQRFVQDAARLGETGDV